MRVCVCVICEEIECLHTHTDRMFCIRCARVRDNVAGVILVITYCIIVRLYQLFNFCEHISVQVLVAVTENCTLRVTLI